MATSPAADDADDPAALGAAWAATRATLPEGWTLDSLRCASGGLSPEERSDDWVAVALGPDGQERAFRAPEPLAALAGLAGTAFDEPG